MQLAFSFCRRLLCNRLKQRQIQFPVFALLPKSSRIHHRLICDSQTEFYFTILIVNLNRILFPAADAAIFAAAVADLRPANPADRKLKKGRDDAALANVPLTENPDILATLAAGKRPDQYVVGFAAETNDVLMNAHAKLQKKNADMIVANQVGDGLAFGTDNNEVWLVTEGDDVLLPLMSKRAVAERLVEVVAAHLD